MYSVDVGDDQSATWGEFAAAAGVKLLPGTPFWHLSIDEGVRSNTLLCGERPEYISDDEVFALVTILAKHTQSPDDCVFGVWDGYGMPEDGARYSADTPDDHAWASAMGDRDAEDSENFGDDWGPSVRERLQDLGIGAVSKRPIRGEGRLSLLGRDYWLHQGSIDKGCEPDPGEQIAELWWPRERSWFLWTDTDAAYAVIGGTPALVNDLISSDAIEAQPYDPGAAHAPDPSWLRTYIAAVAHTLVSERTADVVLAPYRARYTLTESVLGMWELDEDYDFLGRGGTSPGMPVRRGGTPAEVESVIVERILASTAIHFGA